MAERIEEKYLIDMYDYSAILNRISALMMPDKNGINGKYSICSLYFDDAFDTALSDKEDGNAIHIKFRIRTYGGSKGLIKLERKTKRGIITEKKSATLSEEELDLILSNGDIPKEAKCYDLVQEMRSKGLKPIVSVRYDREAFVFSPLGIRVTFDKNIDSLSPDKETLFGEIQGVKPAISRNTIVMEIKYSDRCPAFIRKACLNSGSQLSVSKYALCRNAEI